MPLRLFERRYIDMVTRCLKNDAGFGVCLIESGLEAGKPAKPYPIGCSVRIVDFDQGDDGLLHITVQGQKEFRVISHSIDEAELLSGDVEFFEQEPQLIDTDAVEELSKKLSLILDYVAVDSRVAERRLDDADWVCYRLLELLPLAAQSRFELLDMQSNAERIEALAAMRIELSRR